MKIYYDNDVDFEILKGKKIAVIGYGSQGHAQAKNLRDSGFDVVVSEIKDSKQWKAAESDGMTVMETKKACEISDVIQILVPDQIQPMVYEKEIRDNLKEGDALGFSHGFNIHFGQIVPPEDVDVFMVAPKSPGHLLRRMYEEGFGVPVSLRCIRIVLEEQRSLPLHMRKE